jgi:hypothetical protein
MYKKDSLMRELKKASEDVKKWPDWLKRITTRARESDSEDSARSNSKETRGLEAKSDR